MAFGMFENPQSEPVRTKFPIGHTGHEFDAETGLTYAQARYYHRDSGTFISPDPITFRENDLVSINRYAYGANNPYKYVDPTGRESECEIADICEILKNKAKVAGAAKEVSDGMKAVGEELGNPVNYAGGVVGGAVKGAVIIHRASKVNKITKSASILNRASQATLKAIDKINDWTPKNKHTASSTKRGAAKFNTDNLDEIRALVKEALEASDAKIFPRGDKAFDIVHDFGRAIGTKGQTKLRVTIGYEKEKIWNAFPVNLQ